MGAALPTVAYIAEYRLFVKRPERLPEPIESVFAEQLLDRQSERRQRHQWRGANPVWGSMSDMEQLGGTVLPPVDDVRPIAFTSVASNGVAGEMLYVLQVRAMGGLFHYKLDEAYERRLVHHQKYDISDFAVHPTEDLMICSVQYDDGSCNLAKADREGRKPVEITGGDSRDEGPSWVPGSKSRIVYQTAGIGRDARGIRSGLGPYHIAMLDLDNGSLTTVREDNRFDLLNPHLSSGGDLYCIRRPYDPRPNPTGLLTNLKDAALFPFRLARAVFHFFNAFSMIFSGKPLYTAGGPRRQGPDAANFLLWGRLIEAQQAQRRMAGLQAKPLVPADWQLLVYGPDGQEKVLASHVLSYDLCGDGSVVYTTGSQIMHQTLDGSETRLAESHMVHKVAVIA